MHLEIPALFVQSEQATWVQEYEAALGCCLQRPLEQDIFSLLTVTATLRVPPHVGAKCKAENEQLITEKL